MQLSLSKALKRRRPREGGTADGCVVQGGGRGEGRGAAAF